MPFTQNGTRVVPLVSRGHLRLALRLGLRRLALIPPQVVERFAQGLAMAIDLLRREQNCAWKN